MTWYWVCVAVYIAVIITIGGFCEARGIDAHSASLLGMFWPLIAVAYPFAVLGRIIGRRLK